MDIAILDLSVCRKNLLREVAVSNRVPGHGFYAPEEWTAPPSAAAMSVRRQNDVVFRGREGAVALRIWKRLVRTASVGELGRLKIAERCGRLRGAVMRCGTERNAFVVL